MGIKALLQERLSGTSIDAIKTGDSTDGGATETLTTHTLPSYSGLTAPVNIALLWADENPQRVGTSW